MTPKEIDELRDSLQDNCYAIIKAQSFNFYNPDGTIKDWDSVPEYVKSAIQDIESDNQGNVNVKLYKPEQAKKILFNMYAD